MGKLSMIKKINKNNQGQIAVVVMLVSALLLTLGLSASKKAVTDTRVNTDEELLKQAFNNAESGINNYLNGGGNLSNATVTKLDIGGSRSLSSEGVVLANTSQLFWLVNHDDATGNIGNVYYQGDINVGVDNGYSGALKIDYYYKIGAVYDVQRLVCNYGGSNVVSNPLPATDCSVISATGKDSLLMVVTPLGLPTKITLSGGDNFPLQGQEITSVGTAGDGVKTQVKTRNIYQIPLFFNEAITAKNRIQ